VEGREEGRLEEGQALVLRLMRRRMRSLRPEVEEQVRQLNLEQVERLAEAVFDFQSSADLEQWLRCSVTNLAWGW